MKLPTYTCCEVFRYSAHNKPIVRASRELTSSQHLLGGSLQVHINLTDSALSSSPGDAVLSQPAFLTASECKLTQRFKLAFLLNAIAKTVVLHTNRCNESNV